MSLIRKVTITIAATALAIVGGVGIASDNANAARAHRAEVQLAQYRTAATTMATDLAKCMTG